MKTTSINFKFFTSKEFNKIKKKILEYFSKTHTVKSNELLLFFSIENFQFIEFEILYLFELKKYFDKYNIKFKFVSFTNDNILQIHLK